MPEQHPEASQESGLCLLSETSTDCDDAHECIEDEGCINIHNRSCGDGICPSEHGEEFARPKDR